MLAKFPLLLLVAFLLLTACAPKKESSENRRTMLSQISELQADYRKQGIEVRKMRKAPWQLIAPAIAEQPNEDARKAEAERLGARFDAQLGKLLQKPVRSEVYLDEARKQRLR